MDRVAVLIPCYNEAQTIRKVVSDFRRVLPEAVIYVYDNNSTDETARLAREAGAVVRHERQQGKGNVIRSMFRDIDASCYIMADGDDTYPAESAREMADLILAGEAQMIVGDRLSSTYFGENKRKFHNTGNKLVRGLINLLFKTDIKDIMTGYRAFSYCFVKTFPVLSRGFEIETEMTIHAADKNLSVKNVVVGYRDRPEGSDSKLSTVSDGIRVLRTIVRLFKNYRPLVFFGIISAALLIVSAGFFIPVLIAYFQTGLVQKFPTLIVCGFTAVVGILSFWGGMILDVLMQKSRQDFAVKINEFKFREKELTAGIVSGRNGE